MNEAPAIITPAAITVRPVILCVGSCEVKLEPKNKTPIIRTITPIASTIERNMDFRLLMPTTGSMEAAKATVCITKNVVNNTDVNRKSCISLLLRSFCFLLIIGLDFLIVKFDIEIPPKIEKADTLN